MKMKHSFTAARDSTSKINLEKKKRMKKMNNKRIMKIKGK